MVHDENLFIDDISFPDMLHVHPVKANIPRGRIKNILTPELPEGYGILGPEDIPGNRVMEVLGDQISFFAEDEIEYEGQTIRLIYGPDEANVRNLCGKVRIDYITDFTLLGFRDYKPDQILKEKNVIRGKPVRKSDKHRILTGEYEIGFQSQDGDIISGGFAFQKKGKMLIRGASQWPYFIREAAAVGLGLEPGRIVFQGTAGTRGGESPIWYPGILMFHAALAAFHTKKPCRIVIPSEDSLLYCPERAPALFTFTSTINTKGKVIARKVVIEIDAGSAPIFSDELLDRLCLSVMGAYPLGYIDISARLIRTSNPPLDNFNGLGMAQGFSAVELHENNIAEVIKEDPLDRKKEYCLTQGKPFLTGGIYNRKVKPGELLEKTGELSDFRRKYAAYQLRNRTASQLFPINPRRGIGISLAFQGNGFMSIPPGRFAVSVRLDGEEHVSIRTSSVPAFPRTREIWRETAAEILQVNSSQVEIESIDTAKVPDSGPALFSNNITVIPRLIERCCQAIQKKRFRAPMPIEIKRTFRFPGSRVWNSDLFQGEPFISMSWAATAIEVEMDPISLIPELRGIWMNVDCGRIMDQDYARSVIETSIYRSFSSCIRPGIFGNRGIDLPLSGSSYRLQSPLPLRILFNESRESQPGGIGSLADNTIPSAFLSAVNQASGRSINRLPLSPGELIIRKETGE